ncbi:MAG: hypothetical protein MUE46_18010, partial [Xanthomonadales bacterium]|nr:hypothetical protein [Xanthomonadales bacterium]
LLQLPPRASPRDHIHQNYFRDTTLACKEQDIEAALVEKLRDLKYRHAFEPPALLNVAAPAGARLGVVPTEAPLQGGT